MLRGFKDFVLRGNVVDLAVAVVIGAAFTAVVNAFATDFLTPLIGLVGGGGKFGGQLTLAGQTFRWGAFLSQVITFVLTAAVVYFLIVVPMHTLMERRRRGEERGPVQPTELQLLTEIRDLLRAQQMGVVLPAGADSTALGAAVAPAAQPPFPAPGDARRAVPPPNVAPVSPAGPAHEAPPTAAQPGPPPGRPLPPVPPRRRD